MATQSLALLSEQQVSSTRMESCPSSDRDLYWFESTNPQTTVEKMIEGEVVAEINKLTSDIISAVVEDDIAAKMNEIQPTEAEDKQDQNDVLMEAVDKTVGEPGGKTVSKMTRVDIAGEDEEDQEALLAVARVVDETCNRIAQQNGGLDGLSDEAKSSSGDCDVAIEVDEAAGESINRVQPKQVKPQSDNTKEQESTQQQQTSTTGKLQTWISEAQASSSNSETPALVAASVSDELLSKAEKSADLEEDIEYVVENILDKKTDSNGLAKFLVKWENYPSEANSWEPVENLDCEKKMMKYELRRAERLAKIYGPNATERPPKGIGGPRNKHRVYKVVDIMGLTQVNEEKYFLVSLADDMGQTFIRATLAHRLFPSKVIDFYIQHIKWKSSSIKS